MIRPLRFDISNRPRNILVNAHTLAGISAQTMQRSMPPMNSERVKRSPSSDAVDTRRFKRLRPSENVDAVGNGRSHGRRSHWHVELRWLQASPEVRAAYFSPPFASQESAEFLLDQFQVLIRLLNMTSYVRCNFSVHVTQWVCDQQGEQL